IEAVAEFRLRTVTRLPRIEAVAEFRLLGQESKPLLSLDYESDTIDLENPFTDWDYTFDSHAPYVIYMRKWRRPT
ncbi:unnamed protein product, partial [Rodentolepis nana]|uniref:SAM-dependent methyltransferase n=1 Tax=Rodentolepis nana TaxID=102285 RepID=A0A0R3TT09_RODNA